MDGFQEGSSRECGEGVEKKEIPLKYMKRPVHTHGIFSVSK